MSDWIDHDGKKYYEESYLQLANANAKRCAAENERLREIIDKCGELSTGWKYGDEGFRLLRINSILSGEGA